MGSVRIFRLNWAIYENMESYRPMFKSISQLRTRELNEEFIRNILALSSCKSLKRKLVSPITVYLLEVILAAYKRLH